MSDINQSPSVLVISSDADLVEAIVNNDSADQVFNNKESVQQALDDPQLLDGNGIIIFDIATTDDDVEKSIEQAIQLKQADPTQVLMIVGDKEPLGQILKSSIQPLVYRAFNKPLSANQVFLAFKSAFALHRDLVERKAAGEDISVVGPQENSTNIDTLAAQKKTNPAIFAAVGVAVLGVLGWLVFGNNSDQVVVDSSPRIAPVEETVTAIVDDTVTQTNELNQAAENAVLDGRLIEPAGDNALYYYNQVLILDPYDSIAYEGKKALANTLRSRYADHVKNAEFDSALESVRALRAIEPLNLANDKLHKSLEKSITDHVKQVQASGTSEEIAATSKILSKVESEFESSKSASDALKAEQVLIKKIDAALESDNLIPPSKGNAYSLVSDALKGNKISQSNYTPRVEALSNKLLALANSSLSQDNIEETTKLGALVKRLNVDRKGLSALDKKLKARVAQIAAKKAETDKTESPEVAKEATPEPPKILPAKIISRTPPRYPNRALKNGTEGWVEIKFLINAKGIPFDITVKASTPKGVFEEAAIKSVEKWRFSPARNQTTGLPVESTPVSTKVQFRLS